MKAEILNGCLLPIIKFFLLISISFLFLNKNARNTKVQFNNTDTLNSQNIAFDEILETAMKSKLFVRRAKGKALRF